MFKIGKISSSLYHFKLKDIIERTANPIEVVPDQKYTQIGIRSHGKGIFIKEEVTGAELGNKRVFWVEPDCFIVNIVFAWERAVAKTTSELEGLIASHRFPMYKVNNLKVDLDYFTRLFLTKKGQMLLELASPGGAGRNKTLGQKEFLNLEIDLPTLEIQEYLSSFLKLIDKKIQLQQEKIDLLKNQKKGYMQKIFSQELRFNSNFPEWTHSNLGDISSIEKGNQLNKDTLSKIKNNNNQFPVYNGGVSPSGYTNTFNRKKDNIIISEGGNSCGYVNFINESFFSGGHSYTIIILNESSIDKYFLYSYLKYMQKNIMDLRVGSGLPNIQKTALTKFKVLIPHFEEQKRISEFFSCFDKKIELEIKKLDSLFSQKQSFIQKMFI